MPDPRITPVAKAGRERILVEAVEFARQALSDLTRPENVGEHRGVVVEGERVITHAFDCLLPGYPHWYWTVTLSRVPRSSKVSVDEMSLCPGSDALLAPDWIPWADRVEPSDISPTDRLPYRADDPRLEEGFEETGEEADRLEAFELGLGRPRVLSPLGRKAAFERWYEGDAGPNTPDARREGHVLFVRLPDAHGRGGAGGFRGVRERMVRLRRPGRLLRSRVRLALGDRCARAGEDVGAGGSGGQRVRHGDRQGIAGLT